MLLTLIFYYVFEATVNNQLNILLHWMLAEHKWHYEQQMKKYGLCVGIVGRKVSIFLSGFIASILAVMNLISMSASAFFCWAICHISCMVDMFVRYTNIPANITTTEIIATDTVTVNIILPVLRCPLSRDLHSNDQYQYLHRQYSPNGPREILQREDVWISKGLGTLGRDLDCETADPRCLPPLLVPRPVWRWVGPVMPLTPARRLGRMASRQQ